MIVLAKDKVSQINQSDNRLSDCFAVAQYPIVNVFSQPSLHNFDHQCNTGENLSESEGARAGAGVTWACALFRTFERQKP